MSAIPPAAAVPLRKAVGNPQNGGMQLQRPVTAKACGDERDDRIHVKRDHGEPKGRPHCRPCHVPASLRESVRAPPPEDHHEHGGKRGNGGKPPELGLAGRGKRIGQDLRHEQVEAVRPDHEQEIDQAQEQHAGMGKGPPQAHGVVFLAFGPFLRQAPREPFDLDGTHPLRVAGPLGR